ncbi:MAG TPA: pilus assembly protein N-terminal domain-containing protein [Caulobacteraceae bacterium]|nr:pilus assembly protein N-terminal domain-containing protein [Caulobacteraceae bacterium]
MRRLLLASTFALAPVAVMAATLSVPVDHSIMVTLPAPAHNVFLGSPDVADVAMSDTRHVVVTGKKGGVTNLIVTDTRGHTIFDREVVVGINGGDHVALIAGGTLQSYACAPMCEQVGVGQAPVAQLPSAPQAMAAPAPAPSYSSAVSAAAHP